MTTRDARLWLIYASLLCLAVEFAFLLSAPIIGYPLTFPQSFRLLELMAPVAVGYLGSAAHFVFGGADTRQLRPAHPELLSVIVKLPVFLFALISTIAYAVFGWSNRSGAAPGAGLDIDGLFLALTMALSVLAVTTTVMVGRLFATRQESNAP